MKHFYITLCFATLFTATSARAHEGADLTQDLRALKHNSLSIVGKQQFFESVGIERNGQRIDIGFFGGDAAPYFTQDGLAQASLQSYRSKKIAGVSLYTIGMAALVADLGLSIHAMHDRTFFEDGRGTLQWGLLGGGAAVAIAGIVLNQVATYHLLDAVAQHNGTLLDGVIEQSQKPSVGLGTDGRGASINLSMGF